LPAHLIVFRLSHGMLTFSEPRYVFPHYVASLYKCACRSEFWIEYTDIGRQCCEKSTKVCHSIVFKRCLADGFRGRGVADIFCSQVANRMTSRERVGIRKGSRRRQCRRFWNRRRHRNLHGCFIWIRTRRFDGRGRRFHFSDWETEQGHYSTSDSGNSSQS